MTTIKTIVIISTAVTAMSFVSIAVLMAVTDTAREPVIENIDTSIRVAVLNGCGRTGLAGMFAEKLRNEGFDVVNGMGGNADSFDFDVSVVVDRKSGAPKKAETVARVLGIGHVLLQRSDDPYLIEDVVVILGRDWHTLLTSKEVSAD